MSFTLRLSGLGLRPSGFDPTPRVQRSGLKKTRERVSKGLRLHLVISPATARLSVKIV